MGMEKNLNMDGKGNSIGIPLAKSKPDAAEEIE